jgi:hypothetical protein
VITGMAAGLEPSGKACRRRCYPAAGMQRRASCRCWRRKRGGGQMPGGRALCSSLHESAAPGSMTDLLKSGRSTVRSCP